MKIFPGQPYPLGATYDGAGTNFSLFSEIADRIELCFFDAEGNETRIDLPEMTGYCWHGYVPMIEPGQRYGYRVHGPWDPSEGHRCNPAKLLIDPYTKAIDRHVQWNEVVFPYTFNDSPDIRSDSDSSLFMPRCIVHQPHFDWGGDRRLQHSWQETIIYELNVKGFTSDSIDIPIELRGTYAGLAHPIAIDYLKKLGVTAVELQPIHYFIHEKTLEDQGLRNYWGYNTLGFFAPHCEYACDKRPGAAIAEFKKMIMNLHQADIEVIMDVVYNHTAEGNHLGPLFCFKGIDNASYYRLMGDKHYYMDYTGTGNSLNMRQPHVLQLIMDSLRYWIVEMHVDGFRFDLASTLARELHDVDRLSAFFDIIQQDPVISQVKLIAEPWDVGEGGYQVGNFPPVWTEWNGKYRDCVRDFWRGKEETLGEFACRFAGSADLYENTSRLPYASINFITAHDGFTLQDLVSYEKKANEANGENNHDGENHNRSWNCGVEGPTDDQAVISLRNRQKLNFLTTLLLSQGVPMILAGDEMGRTQQGNNNAYCQDNQISWHAWDKVDYDLLSFCKKLIQYRKEHIVFHRRGWFEGKQIPGSLVKDIAWFTTEGKEMIGSDWENKSTKSLGVYLNGETIPNPNLRSEPATDDNFYIIFNAHDGPLDFTLPGPEWGDVWFKDLDTFKGWPVIAETVKCREKIRVEPYSMVVLRHAS
ncbi:MAG: glycogen debranching protein GlgX [Parachlamydiaceae bacterium]|nr:glycogen debranching protein GlgX [Parachlamydiaceae bacterium]